MADQQGSDDKENWENNLDKDQGITSWGHVEMKREAESGEGEIRQGSNQISGKEEQGELSSEPLAAKKVEDEVSQAQQVVRAGVKKSRTTKPSLLVDYRRQKEEEAAQVVTEKHLKERKIPWLILGVVMTIILVPTILVWGCFSEWSGFLSVIQGEFTHDVDEIILSLPIPKPAKIMVVKGWENWQEQRGWRVTGRIDLPGWRVTWQGNEIRKGNPEGAYDWKIEKEDQRIGQMTTELEGKLFEDGVMALAQISTGGQLPATKINNWQTYQGQYWRTPLLRNGDQQLSPGQLGLLRVREKKLRDLYNKFEGNIAERVTKSGSGEYRSYLTGDEVAELGTEWMAVMEEGQDTPWASEQITRKIWRQVGERWGRIEVVLKVQSQPLVISEIRFYGLPAKYSQPGEGEVLEKEKLESAAELVIDLKFGEFGQVSVADFPSERVTATKIPMNELMNWEFIAEWLE